MSWFSKQTLFRFVPAIGSLRTYSTRVLALDTMAGLTVAAVAVPQAMAYAALAGLPPQYGLYTAIVMTSIGALFDSSKQLINGPTNATSIATFSALAVIGSEDKVAAAVLITLMVGLVQLSIALSRLGDLSKFISHAVIVGFTVGAGALIILGQIENLLGLPKFGGAEDYFLIRIWQTWAHYSETNPYTLALGLATIMLSLALRAINRRFSLRLPEFLLTIIVVAVAVWFWNLEARGVKIVGKVPPELPSFAWPQLRWDWARELFGGAIAIALLGLLEAISMAKAIAAQTRQKLDIDQQCLSEAFANLGGSFFQCFPGSGSLTRSTINQQAGGQTQWSGVISAVAVALMVVLFGPYAYYIPRSALAGVLLISAVRLVDWPQLVYYLRTTRFDACIVAATAISAVVVSVEFCVLIGVLMSFVLYVPRAARVHMTELMVTEDRTIRERFPSDEPCERIRIFSLEGELFFGASPQLEANLDKIVEAALEGTKVVILRMKRARNPDAVCMQVLRAFLDRMHELDVPVVICGIRPDLQKVLDSGGVVDALGQERVFVFQETGRAWTATLEALRCAYDLLGDDTCQACPRHADSLKQKNGWNYII
jgi:sulfate permease, SulP family